MKRHTATRERVARNGPGEGSRPKAKVPSASESDATDDEADEEPKTRIGRVTKPIVETRLRMEALMADPPNSKLTLVDRQRFIDELTPFMMAMGQHKRQILEGR